MSVCLYHLSIYLSVYHLSVFVFCLYISRNHHEIKMSYFFMEYCSFYYKGFIHAQYFFSQVTSLPPCNKISFLWWRVRSVLQYNLSFPGHSHEIAAIANDQWSRWASVAHIFFSCSSICFTWMYITIGNKRLPQFFLDDNMPPPL